MTDHAPFDLDALTTAIERARSERGLSWAALSRTVGVAPSTIRRFATATDAEADGVLALVAWLGVAPEEFVDAATPAAQPLPVGEGQVRVDIDVLAAAEAWPPDHGRTRTTIQHLVRTALRSGRSIASFTRVCER